MNRLESQNLAAVTPDRLPPAVRRGPARVLFIHHNMLGHVTHARNMRQYTAVRDDIDAVHIDLVRPLWVKVLNATPPLIGRWDFRHYRSLVLWRPILRRWLSGPLDLSRFDVVHFLNPLYAWAVLDLRKQGRAGAAKLAVNSDCTAALFARELGWPRITQMPVETIERRIFAEAQLAVAMSRWAAASMTQDYGVPPERICITPGCVPDEFRSQPASRPRSSAALPRIIFIGTDWVRKGGPTLLAVHQKHFADRAELHIVSSQARPDPSARNVVWHGAVGHQELVTDLLPSMDVMALPTTNDMSPFVLLEAAAAGVPAVATRMGGIHEMIIDGQTGLLFSPDCTDEFVRELGRLLSDATLRRQMGQSARRHVAAEFDPKRVYNQFIDRVIGVAG